MHGYRRAGAADRLATELGPDCDPLRTTTTIESTQDRIEQPGVITSRMQLDPKAAIVNRHAKPQDATKLVSQAGRNVSRCSLKLSSSRIINIIDNIELKSIFIGVNF